MAATQTEVRRLVGTILGDATVLSATAAGSTDTFTDARHLVNRGDNAPSLMDRLLYFSGGPTTDNYGHEARITGFVAATSTLSFDPDAPSATTTGDEVEVWSNWSRWGGIAAIHQLINEGIRSVENIAGPQVWDTEQLFSRDSPELTIPSTWCEFGGVERQDQRGRWIPINEQWYRVREGLGTIELHGRAALNANNYSVRMYGYERCEPFGTDPTETTPVDPMWLAESVAQVMRLASSWRSSDRQAEERTAQFWAAAAADYRRKIGTMRTGMGKRLQVQS